MKSDFFIITNNPLVNKKLGVDYQLEYHKGDYMKIIKSARDYVYAGHTLLTHPLSGSLKPNETPYRSVMITKDKQKLDFKSVEIMENSIQICENFSSITNCYQKKVLVDFQYIDYSLIESAINSIGQIVRR